MKPFSGSVLRLGTCLGEMINDRSNSFRRRIQEQPNESLTVLTLIKFKDLRLTISELLVRMQEDYTRAEYFEIARCQSRESWIKNPVIPTRVIGSGDIHIRAIIGHY
jgi:hypothetical protein